MSAEDEKQPSRRRFLEIATVAMGGLVGAALAIPLVRYVLFPVRRHVVSHADKPIDVLPVDALTPGAPPMRVQLRADAVRDGWAVADNTPLGAAWVRKTESGAVEALSATCPHLGCAIDFQGDVFTCPCHKSAFAVDGEKLSGPAKRGLDPLPVTVEEGRVKIRFVRYRPDVPRSEAGGPVMPGMPGKRPDGSRES